MENLIVADKLGNEIRVLTFTSYDFEVGKTENSFQVKIRRKEYESIPSEGRIYIPGTEYGGLYRRIETNTKEDVICPGGITWRGMMQKKIIVPPAGEDYATDSGEINDIIRTRVQEAFPGMFIGTNTDTGITTNYQYNRYCTLEEGLTKMLKEVGYKLDIQYSQTDKAVVVQAVPIEDYAYDVEFSSDMELNYSMVMQKDGVNHLICLGSGELRDREVIDMYMDANGNITNTQYYFGVDEITDIYDYPGAETDDLRTNGERRFRDITNNNVFQITVNSNMDIAIGDIVGGRDYLSGMSMKAPITGKIVKWENGFRTIEYKLEDDVVASL